MSERTRQYRRADLALPTVETLEELERYLLQEPEICMRYSVGPMLDRPRPSIDYESGLLLPGLPATPLLPEAWWTRDRRDWLARQIWHSVCRRIGGDDKRPWLLIGRFAGYGPDREHLLWPWTPVAWLGDEAIDQANARYVKYFEQD